MKKYTLILFSIFSLSSLHAQETIDSLNVFIQNFQFNKALQWIDSQEKTKRGEFQKAMCYKALGENRKAITVLKELAEEYPEDVSIKTELAQCYERSSKWQDTADSYADLMAIDTLNVYFSIKKAEAEINRKNINTAIRDLTEIVRKDTLMSAVRLLGKSYETVNNLDTALHYYHMGWDRDISDVFSAANLVNTYIKKKDYTSALAYAQRYVESDTTNSQMNFLHGYSHYALEDYETAKDILQECYSAGDSSLVVGRALGMSYYFLGKEESENAYKHLSKAYEQDTTNSTVLHHLAISASDVGQYDEAVVYFTKMLHRLIPSDMQLYLNYRGLALAYEKTEQYYEAAQCYEKAFENANADQRFYLAEPLAHIYNEHLDRKEDALHYYRTYRTSLDGRRLNLKYAPEDNTGEIAEIDAQLIELDKFISELDDELAEKSKKKKGDVKYEIIDADPNLYIVNGEVTKDLPPMDKIINARTLFKLDKASEEDEPFIVVAKEKGKTRLVFFDIDVPEKVDESVIENKLMEEVEEVEQSTD